MTHVDSSAATDSGTPLPRPRRLLFWSALATLALVIVVGGVWALGRDGSVTPPPATVVHQTADHSVAVHGDSQSHAAMLSSVDPHMDDAPGDHGADATHAEAAAHGHAELGAHSDGETPAHDDEAAGHVGAGAAHTADGHGDEAAPLPASTRQVVLGSFAGVNALAIVAAGILRRRNPPRLPKHLQR